MMPSEEFKNAVAKGLEYDVFKTTLSDFEELMMFKYSDTLDSLSARKCEEDGTMLTLFYYLDTYCGTWCNGEAWEFELGVSADA